MEQESMTIRDICKYLVCDLHITFDEDCHDGMLDIMIPVSAEPEDILSDNILDMEVHLMMARDDALIISTDTRCRNDLRRVGREA